jgi:hypothetical protein
VDRPRRRGAVTVDAPGGCRFSLEMAEDGDSTVIGIGFRARDSTRSGGSLHHHAQDLAGNARSSQRDHAIPYPGKNLQCRLRVAPRGSLLLEPARRSPARMVLSVRCSWQMRPGARCRCVAGLRSELSELGIPGSCQLGKVRPTRLPSVSSTYAKAPRLPPMLVLSTRMRPPAGSTRDNHASIALDTAR